MSYQDTLDETGAVVAKGYRECEERYRVIRAQAAKLRRPFTVLDLGAAEGYFSVRLAQDFGARCTAVESRDVIRQADLASVVQKDVDAEDVRLLGTYDVVLGLSFLHHVPDWRGMLEQMDRSARSLLVVETPTPEEKLRSALNRHQLGAIQQAVMDRCGVPKGFAPSVWDDALERGLWIKRREGLPVRGVVQSGGGNNNGHVRRFLEDLEPVLGYVPFPGSMNVHTKHAFRLGAYCAEYVDPRRGRGGRRGGDYQIWHARVEGYDGPAHVIRPGVRGHGRNCLEVWAPVKLREHLGLGDGDEVSLRIGA